MLPITRIFYVKKHNQTTVSDFVTNYSINVEHDAKLKTYPYYEKTLPMLKNSSNSVQYT